jgi:hypothetical protein
MQGAAQTSGELHAVARVLEEIRAKQDELSAQARRGSNGTARSGGALEGLAAIRPL